MHPMSILNPFAPEDVRDADLTVLLWNNHWFGEEYEQAIAVSTPTGARINLNFTRDRSLQPKADAVWIHAPTIRDLPPKLGSQPWILVSMEAFTHYSIQADEDVVGLFDLTMTHRLDADVPTPYANRRQYGAFQPGPRPPQRPTALVSFIASNPVARRDDFVRELTRYMPVDCYGACLNNRRFDEVAPPGASYAEEALWAIASHPFYLSFENVREPDYVTEKLYRPLSVGTIPVYWGAPNASEFLPSPDAVVLLDEETSPRRLAELITATAADAAKLEAHRAWMNAPLPHFQRLLDLGDIDPRARLATKLAHGCSGDCGCGGRLRRRLR